MSVFPETVLQSTLVTPNLAKPHNHYCLKVQGCIPFKRLALIIWLSSPGKLLI
jgi:hypothetical protein